MTAPSWLKAIASPLRLALRVARPVIHIVVVLAVAVGLWAIGWKWALDRFLDSRFPALHPFWLPGLFVLLYCLVRVGLWLNRALEADRPIGDYPDLDTAWSDVLAALDRANIDLKATPTYLVFGRPTQELDLLFAAARVPLLVRAVPSEPDAPVRVYAHHQAIFLCCPGVSLLDRHLASGANSQASPRLLADPDVVQRHTNRLAYVCRQLARARAPYCPVNGLLWALPIEAVAPEALAEEVGGVCLRDLVTVRRALRTRCPSVFSLTDLDQLEGVESFLTRLSNERLAGPLGLTFPVAPAVDADGRRQMIEDGAGWLCRRVVPVTVAEQFRTERPGEVSQWPAAADNASLVLVASQAAGLERSLVQFLRAATATPPGEPPLTGGCYFVATGADSARQAFAAAPLNRLAELQNAVAWSPDVAAEETTCNRLAFILGAILVGWLIVLIFAFIKQWLI